jgi:hypothetical protein
MLYSDRFGIGLARHPKTASSALTVWFLEAFPDAKASDPHDPHVSVPVSLRRFGLVATPKSPPKWHTILPKPLRPRPAVPALTRSLTVIGVIREPFEMLVSLYSYWRRNTARKQRRPGTLSYTAAHGSFRDFVVHAVIERKLPNYHDFFGVGLPEQPSLELIDFRSIHSGLETVCREHGVQAAVAVPVANEAPSNHDYDRFRDEVRFMLPAIRSRYRWYYEEASRRMAKSSGSLTLRPAA